MKGHPYAIILSALLAAVCLGCSNTADSSSSARKQAVKVRTGNATHEIDIRIPAGADINLPYPTVYMMDKELFDTVLFVFYVDSLTYADVISPILLVATDDISTDLISEVEKHINANGRIFYGNGAGADSGLQFSITAPKDLFKEYWCFNPSPDNINAASLSGTTYRINWNLKNNTEAYYDKYPAFVYSLRKRGATIIESTYNDYNDLPSRIIEFLQMIIEVFPAQPAR